MNKYYQLLERFVGTMPEPDQEARKAIYARAIEVARSQKSQIQDPGILASELSQLREAILLFEQRYSQPAPGQGTEDAANQPNSKSHESEPGPAPEPRPAPEHGPVPKSGENSGDTLSSGDMASSDIPPAIEFTGPVVEDDTFEISNSGQKQSDDTASRPIFILLTAAIIASFGFYHYFTQPSHLSNPGNLSKTSAGPSELPKGIKDLKILSEEDWRFGATDTRVHWKLETRTSLSPEYFLGQQAVRGTAPFASSGIAFTVDLQRLVNSTGGVSHSILLRYKMLQEKSPEVLKMYVPRVILAKAQDGVELDGVVVRLGGNGFLVQFPDQKTGSEITRILLAQSLAIEFPLIMDTGEKKSLLANLPKNLAPWLENGD
jgi:hypothetical protein